jgi:hypothetical protein
MSSRNVARSTTVFAVTLVVCLLSPTRALAQEKKDEKKKEPRITVVAPLAVTAGSKVTLKVRGLELAEAKEVRIGDGKPAVKTEVKSKGKVPVPEKLEAKDVGDTEVQVELEVPADAPAGDLGVVVVTTAGETKPYALPVHPREALADEKEPNGGFRGAQDVLASSASATVRGAVQENNDVDVFRVPAKAGQTLKAEVTAARRGSALDAVLTVYDSRGQVVASADDSAPADDPRAARDPSLSVKLPADGVYYLALNDANDRGSTAHPYLLTLAVGD